MLPTIRRPHRCGDDGAYSLTATRRSLSTGRSLHSGRNGTTTISEKRIVAAAATTAAAASEEWSSNRRRRCLTFHQYLLITHTRQQLQPSFGSTSRRPVMCHHSNIPHFLLLRLIHLLFIAQPGGIIIHGECRSLRRPSHPSWRLPSVTQS